MIFSGMSGERLRRYVGEGGELEGRVKEREGEGQAGECEWIIRF